MTQHMNGDIRKGTQTLNLLISRESSSSIVYIPSVYDPCLSSNKDQSFGDQLTV